ncbi:MAG: rhodanese-like domain-containing protein [Candidatus Gottesmanbacteria bacterium]|nr:rhodanese-like domain-containing protein [Candidatus Gottesmanbacteria bacterium]
MKKRSTSFATSFSKLPHKNIVLFFIIVSMTLIAFNLGRNETLLRRLIASPLSVFQSSKESVSAKELKKLLAKKDFAFINVHTPYEGEIEKTDTFVAYDQMVAQSASLPKDKNTPIILYCKTGRMSGEAIVTMQKMGYTNVRHLVGGMDAWTKTGGALLDLSSIEKEVLPEGGIELPITWGDIGPRLIALGVIDETKFRKAVNLTPEQEEILTKGSDKKITIDTTNGQFVVDMLWAMGLAQKSIVYEEGPMGREYKKDAGNFASTGGWSLARGAAMQYLNRFDLVVLTPEQQKKVGEIAQNVYRPCCGNSTWFPDCNHGMAALAAIELMVAAGIDEKAIYRNVLALNTYWFSDTYVTIATHFARQGIPWKEVDAKMILGKDYSSAQGAQAIAKKVGPLPYKPQQQGGGCGA